MIIYGTIIDILAGAATLRKGNGMTTALVLGGGAPNLTLMSGALLALDEAGVEFDVVSTTGAGMLIGLLYTAPARGDRRAALRNTVDMAVADPIYDVFPINYKVFYKPGPWAEVYAKTMLPWLQALPKATPTQRLWRDWIWFGAAAMSPSDLNASTLGLCQPPPWIEHAVNFETIQDFDGDFFMSAYNIDRARIETFADPEITSEHFKAALAMPFIYSPFTLQGETYIEGSALETLNFESLIEAKGLHIDTAVTFDILGQDQLIGKPRSLYDAWVKSIITPLTKLAQQDIEIFENITDKEAHRHIQPLRLEWADLIPEDHWPKVMDWSESNMRLLFDVGRQAGERFFARHGESLTLKSDKAAGRPGCGKGAAYRPYPHSVPQSSLTGQEKGSPGR